MIEELRRDPRFAGLPVVVFTAWGDAGVRRRLAALAVRAIHIKADPDLPALLKSVADAGGAAD